MSRKSSPFRITDKNGVVWQACKECRIILTPKNWVNYSGGGVGHYCKKCNNIRRKEYADRRRDSDPVKFSEQIRKRILKYNYGLSIDKYEEMLKMQNGVCLICKKVSPGDRRLSVDHNHKTGEVRSLLCNNCNAIVGLCDENPDLLMKIVNYLIKFSNMEKEFQFEGM